MMTETQTPEMRAAGIKIIKAIIETIRIAKEIPSGTLYAALMEHGCTIHQYEEIIGAAKRMGLISTTEAGLIRWNGRP